MRAAAAKKTEELSALDSAGAARTDQIKHADQRRSLKTTGERGFTSGREALEAKSSSEAASAAPSII